LQRAGLRQCFAQPDDPRKPVNDEKAAIAWAPDQHAAGIGTKVDGRILGNISGPAPMFPALALRLLAALMIAPHFIPVF
jgi:hypothetical protein